jgi:hypothetical protein
MTARSACLRLLGLALVAGTSVAVHAQPTLDGQLDATAYGPMIWAQNQKLKTPLRDNFAGAGGAAPTDQVVKGIELSIPVSAIGYTSGALKMCMMVTGNNHFDMSNQVLGGLQGNQGNQGSIRAVNLGALPGTHTITFTPIAFAATSLAPVIDGQMVGLVSNATQQVWGTAKSQQTNFTGYGDAQHGACMFGSGSELDALYAYITGSGTTRMLHLFIAGNLESNGNGLEIFFDTVAGGQNRLLFGNAGSLANMSGTAVGSTDGLTFDAGFTADYWVGINGANGDPNALPPIPAKIYVDYQAIPTDPVATPPVNVFLGTADYCSIGGTVTPDPLNPPPNGSPVISCTIDNGNTGGVSGSPPGGQAPNIDIAYGSEIDNVYATVDTANNRLWIFIGGNLASDYSKMSLFLDTRPGGQNRLLGTNVDISFNGLNRMGDNGTGNGLTFDAGFEPDYWMGVNIGGSPLKHFVDSAVLRTGGPNKVPFLGGNLDYGSYSGAERPASVNYPSIADGAPPRLDGQDGSIGNIYSNYAPGHISDYLASQSFPAFPALIPPNATAGKLQATYDNTNVGGVTTTSTANAASVNRGIEISVDLNEIGWDGTSCIKLSGFLHEGTNYERVSNQVIGGLPGDSANLGEVRAVSFNTLAGDQFVTLYCPPVNACNADYNRDTFLNLDDLGDFITDYYTCPPIPGGAQANAPTYAGQAVGYGQVCPDAPDAPAPYAVNAYRANGFRVGYSSDGSNSCPLGAFNANECPPFFPNLDNLGDYITFYYASIGTPGC